MTGKQGSEERAGRRAGRDRIDEARRSRFQAVRAAVFANLAAAGRVDPPLRTPERVVHACLMLLFLGWGKFEDRVATSRIAELVGWWDGESIPPGETRPRPERHIRRRISNALATLARAGLIGYEPAVGAPGREGQNLTIVTLLDPSNGTVASGPVTERGQTGTNGTAASGPVSPAETGPSTGQQRGHLRVNNGTVTTGPHRGNLGNWEAYARTPEDTISDVDRLAADLAAVATVDRPTTSPVARAVVELLLDHYGVPFVDDLITETIDAGPIRHPTDILQALDVDDPDPAIHHDGRWEAFKPGRRAGIVAAITAATTGWPMVDHLDEAVALEDHWREHNYPSHAIDTGLDTAATAGTKRPAKFDEHVQRELGGLDHTWPRFKAGPARNGSRTRRRP